MSQAAVLSRAFMSAALSRAFMSAILVAAPGRPLLRDTVAKVEDTLRETTRSLPLPALYRRLEHAVDLVGLDHPSMLDLSGLPPPACDW